MNSLKQEIIKVFKAQLKKEFAPFMWIFGRDRAVEVSKDNQTDECVSENKMHTLAYIWFRAALFCAIFYFWFAEWIGKLLDIDEAQNADTGIALTLGLAMCQTIYVLRAAKK